MYRLLIAFMSVFFFFVLNLFANEKQGLNIVVTSGNIQTQKMAMVLSMMTLYQGKNVNMVLCSKAANLALKNSINVSNQSPKALLQAILKKGAEVKVCEADLEELKSDSLVLLDGVIKSDNKKYKLASPNIGYEVLSYLE